MRRAIYLSLGMLVAGIVTVLFIGPTSAEVRIDCGDIRYCFLGIPVREMRLPEAARSDLLAIAKTSAKLPPRWIWINLDTQHGTDVMCFQVYQEAAPWARVDPAICRLLLEDSAEYVQTRHWQWGLPRTIGDFYERSADGLSIIPADWSHDERVQEYCRERGYTLPERRDYQVGTSQSR